MITISEYVKRLIKASIHYRNRQILFCWVMSEHNRKKYLEATKNLKKQKNDLLIAISKGNKI